MPSVRWWSRFSGCDSAASSARAKLSIAGSSSRRELGDAAGLGLRDVAARALAHVVELGHRAQVLVAVVGLGRRLGLGLGRVVRGLGDARRGRVRLRARTRRRRPAGRPAASSVRGRRARRRSASPSPAAGAAASSAAARCVGLGRGRAPWTTTSPRPRPRRRRRPPPRRPAAPSSRPRRCAGRGRCCCWARSYIASETLWKDAWSASVFALISFGSSEVRLSRTSLIAASISSLRGGVDLLGEVLELALGLVGGVLAAVAGLRELTGALVLVGVRLGVVDHALDLVVAAGRRRRGSRSSAPCRCRGPSPTR